MLERKLTSGMSYMTLPAVLLITKYMWLVFYFFVSNFVLFLFRFVKIRPFACK